MATKISSIVDVIKSKIINKLSNKYNCSNYLSSNSTILRLYFHFGTLFCFLISSCVFYNVFMTSQILCHDGYGNIKDTNGKINILYENYCLSYPLLSNDRKKFALFYKWIPWIMLLLSVLLYTPKIVINNSSCNFIASSLTKINDNSNNNTKKSKNNKNKNNKQCDEDYFYDDFAFDTDNNDNSNNDNNNNNNNYQINYDIKELIYTRWNKCKNIYWGCMISHIYALILNIGLIFLLDFLLQGRFLLYVPKTFPFNRDAIDFTDPMSQTFYPFAECNIKDGTLIIGRSERAYCHLTFMEYYEKIFFIIWLYLFIMPFLLFFHIIYLLFLWRNNYNAFFEYLLRKNLSFNLYYKAKKIINKKQRKNSNAKV